MFHEAKDVRVIVLPEVKDAGENDTPGVKNTGESVLITGEISYLELKYR